MKIELRKITDDNVGDLLDLQVTEGQEDYVGSNLDSLATAYICDNNGGRAIPYAIYAGDEMVGFVMYGYLPEAYDDTYGEDCYYLWRFMIDKNHQGKGYGTQAIAQVLDEIRQKPHGAAQHCYTQYEPENIPVKKMYEKLGFEETGEEDDGELIMRMKI
ncbi:MAG: GNAT family N-acetyltransferase [Defluviitaleaceae bacterium]|nr:GNAT family N-acetyltransferase [Defluviitaleaceae bacterium]